MHEQFRTVARLFKGEVLLGASGRERRSKNLPRHILAEELHAAVAENGVTATDVITEWLVIRATVVGGPRTSSRSAARGLVLIDEANRSDRCIRRTRDTAAVVSISPAIRYCLASADT